MRLGGIALLFAFVFGSSPAFAQQEADQSGDVLGIEQVEAVVETARAQLASLDGLITAQEASLDGLYEQRDAATTAGNDDRVSQLDVLIDRLNLTLTNLEIERTDIADAIATLRGQIDVLKAEEE